MKQFKTLIVENDEASLNELKYHLKDFQTLTISAEAKTCTEAISLLINESFLVSILDVELPDGNCFDITNRISKDRLGEIVCYTGFGNRYYEDLFKLNPIAYLPKPPSLQGVQDMMIKIDQLYERRAHKKFIELYYDENSIRYSVLVSISDILFIRSESRKCTYYYQKTMQGAAKKHYKAFKSGSIQDQINLLTIDFIQCSKNEIINLNYFEKFTREKDGNKYTVYFENDELISLSKNYKEVVFHRKGVINYFE